jgi:quercetin dioxygenase-like cupin family protein
MHPNNIPFHTTDWSKIPATEHKGETGMAYWRTLQFGDLRVRMVEYSPNYKADHWCQKGHLLFVIEGEMTTELVDGQLFTMQTGVSYQVSDDLSSHRSFTENGAKLIIIDGAFLALKG